MIRHLAGVTEIVDDVDAAVAFYAEHGRPSRRIMPDYAIVDMPGVLVFRIASRALYAEATLGSRVRANDISLGFVVGFEVDSADATEAQLGDRLVRVARDEHAQRTVRFLSVSGIHTEASETPGSRTLVQPPVAE